VTGLCGGGGVESERAATTIGVANEFGCWDSLLRALRGTSSKSLYTTMSHRFPPALEAPNLS